MKNPAEEKRNTYATGGAPASKNRMTDLDLKLKAVLHDSQISGLESLYESDFMNTNNNQEDDLNKTTSDVSIEVENNLALETEQQMETSCSWQNYHPAQLKKPVNSKLKIRQKLPNTTSWMKAKWCEKKAKQEMEMQESEHQSRLRYWDKKLEMEQIEHEQRMKLMQEKHDAEMKEKLY